MTYFISAPSRGTERLHRSGCPRVDRRTRRIPLVDRAAIESYIGFLRDLPTCEFCLPDGVPAEARAVVWRSTLDKDRRELAEGRVRYARWQRQQAAKNAFLAQFESLRAACEVAWGNEVRWAGYSGGERGNLAFQLGHPVWYDCGSIYLRAEHGAQQITVAGMNFGSSVISEARDAHALSTIFTLIDCWRAAEPFDVPADAPEFYNVA